MNKLPNSPYQVGGGSTIPVRDRTLRGNQGRSQEIWFMQDIFLGDTSKHELHHVQPGDMVREIVGSNLLREYIVKSVDDVTRIPTLVPIRHYQELDASEDAEMRYVGPGPDSETWRIFYDDTLEPYTLRIDSNLFFRGSLVTHYKIFKGVNTSSITGKVISQWRDNNANRIDENVPVELAAWEDNVAIKVPLTAHTTERLDDGEVLTVVAYGADGDVYSINKLKVVKTAEVRRSEAAKRIVTGVSLVSSFLSSTEDRLIEFPINMAREAVFMMARVEYSDGTFKELPIDQGRVFLHGWSTFEPTFRGQESEMVLVYNLAENEDSTQAQRGEVPFVKETYKARTRGVEGSYSVRLCVVPRFVGQEWELEYYLFNLDRNAYYNVTEVVEAAANQAPFNPRKYGQTQRVVVSLDISKVDSSFSRFRHVQAFEIALMGTAAIDTTPFFISYRPGQDPIYGENLRITQNTVSAGNRRILLASGIGDFNEWIDRLFYRIDPLRNEYTEQRAPMPTHIVVKLNDGHRFEIPVEEWNREHAVPRDYVNTVAQLDWIRRDQETIQYLGTSPIIVKGQ